MILAAIRNNSIAVIASVFLFVCSFGTLLSAPFKMSYSGRIVNPDGIPVLGPIQLKIRFFDAQTEGNQIGLDKDFENVALQEGIFQVVMPFVSNELSLVFSDQNETWIQITDITNNLDFERQMLTSMPFALRIPVDGESLKFSEADGKLHVHQLKALTLKSTSGTVSLSPHENTTGDIAYTLPQKDGAAGNVLATQGNGKLVWSDLDARINPLDSNQNNSADRAEDSAKLNGQSPEYYLNMDHMVGGDSNAVFTVSDKAKLDLLQTSANVNASSVATAGAVMETDLPNSAGILTTDGSGGIGINASAYESDPQVGTITTNGNWCTTDGSAIQCDQSPPLLQSDVGTDPNEIIRLDGSGQLPGVDGSQLSNLNLTAPGAIGSTTPNSAEFTTTTTRAFRLNDDGTDGGTNYMTLLAPDLGDNTTSYTLPATPSNGLFLSTDSDGILSWVNPNTSNDSDIATNTANISANTSALSGKQDAVTGVSDTEIGHLDGVTSGIQSQLDSKQATVTDVDDTEIGYLNGVTSGIQSQLNAKQAVVSGVDDTEIGHLNGVTSSIQTQLNGKQAVVTNVDNTEIGYLNGVTSSIQTQLNGKQAVVTNVDNTEIGYLNGVTSSIQTQLNGKQNSIGDNGLSGNAIDGGIISDFASEGIDDNASSTAITIKADNSVGIGATNPSSSLHFAASTAQITIQDNDSDEATNSYSATILFIDNADDQAAYIGFGSSGSTDFTVHARDSNLRLSSSAAITSTTSIGTHSDRRLKKNITPIQDSLQQLSQIEGVHYVWKDEENPNIVKPNTSDIGVIAQDVEKVFPEAVYTMEDGYKMVAYSKLIGPLIQAVNELNSKHAKKDALIESLHQEIQLLKTYLCEKEPQAPICHP